MIRVVATGRRINRREGFIPALSRLLLGAPGVLPFSWTLLPSRSCSTPSTTTTSPGTRPSAISASSLKLGPILTWRTVTV